MKLISTLFATIVACSALATSIAHADNPQPNTTKPKVADVWIDVRSSSEYHAGHLQGAHNIPHTDIANKITKIAPSKSTPIHVYCRSGSRANDARKTLLSMGYTNVTNHGGYDNLKRQGHR